MKFPILVFTVFILFLGCQTTEEAGVLEDKDIFELARDGETQQISGLLDSSINLNAKDIEGRTPLHYAAQEGNVNVIETLLTNGSNPNVQDSYGLTPLHLAIINRENAAALILLDFGANPMAETIMGENAVTFAIARDFELLEAMLTEENVNSIAINGETPLHWAVKQQDLELTAFILSIGANVNAADESGKIALDYALQYDTLTAAQIARELIKSESLKAADQDFDYIYKVFVNDNPLSRYNYGKTALHLACERNHTGFLELFLSFIPRPELINVQDNTGNAPLHTAVWKEDPALISLLLSAGADVNLINSFGNSVLHEAIKANSSIEILSLLLESGASMQIKNNHGNTPVHLAAIHTTDKAVLELLNPSNDLIDYRNNIGNTALAEAVINDRKESAEYLLEKRTDIFALNNSGDTPVSLALNASESVFNWFFTPETINRMDNNGETPLHYAVIEQLGSETINNLLLKGADVNSRNFYGDTPLHLALRNQDLNSSRLLLSYGAHLFATNNIGETPLSISFSHGVDFTDNFLINDLVDNENSDKETPLFVAIREMNLPIIKLLIFQKNADLEHLNTRGQTPLFTAIYYENAEIIRTLLDAGAQIDIKDYYGNTPFFEVAQLSDPYQIGSLLLSYGADINIRNEEGRTVLHEAVINGNSFLIQFLLDQGADINTVDLAGKTPLFYAVSEDYLDIVTFLTRKGALVEYRDQDGNTVLHEAILLGRDQIAIELLRTGSDIFALNKRGNTPMDLALMLGPEVVDWFFTPGNIHIVDNSGNTPLHFAVRKSASLEVVQLLISKGADIYVRNSQGKRPVDIAKSKNLDYLIPILTP